MKQLIQLSLLILILMSLHACKNKEQADLILTHATIYTVDDSFSTQEAMAVKDGKIIATGTTAELENRFSAKEKLDAAGKFIYPGLIDAHAHFLNYGLSLQQAMLIGTTSWEDVLAKVKEFAATHPDGWITGRGWDQNDWATKTFPTSEKLDELFPDRPVLLKRIDGHAAIANSIALKIANIKAGDTISGGVIEANEGTLTGILVDNAISLVTRKIPDDDPSHVRKALLDAQRNCFAAGLTTIDDCGLSYQSIEFIKQLQDEGVLKMRLYVLLSDTKKDFDFAAKNGKIKTDYLNVQGFKLYADGALGSRGACLLAPYSDRPNEYGFLLSTLAHFDSAANWLYQKGWQMCTHAIGDSGNRTMLNIYARYLKGKNDRRWRIEHAQVINRHDFHLFGDYSIIPSVQPTHATSDMYWAGERLGKIREAGAYANQQLLQQNGWIPLGTDFPIEDISPLKTFYAAVFRKDAKGWPEAGYQIENALTREEAIRGMTIWAARANFEEKEKGSLEAGKFADFVILDTDLLTATPEQILAAKVLSTYVGGEKVFETK